MLASSPSKGQYIDSVYSFVPAPGQYTNSSWGNNESAESLQGGLKGKMSLGAFGGYVVFAFENPVENHPNNPFGVDFSIFGNSTGSWSEPAVVYVMQDKNDNGIPDDIWYELAGSDHFFSSTIKNYEVEYSNPNAATDVPWTDNLQNSGVIDQNEFHTQAYYPSAEFFPAIDQVSFFLNGTRISPTLDYSQPGFIRSYERTFGYADNHTKGDAPYDMPDNPYTEELENGGGDAFDIDWAIDENDAYVDLTEIDFVKVQNACMVQSGTLGYLSAEILGAVDIKQGETQNFLSEIIVIKDLPTELNATTLQAEAAVFRNGRYLKDADIMWECNQNQATISTSGEIRNLVAGLFTLTASYRGTELISNSISTTILGGNGQALSETEDVKLYPNPTTDYLCIETTMTGLYSIYNTEGVKFHSGIITNTSIRIDVSELPAGLYIVHFEGHKQSSYHKILIGN